MDKQELKERVFKVIDARSAEIIEIGETIWRNPEPGYKEFKTAETVSRIFKSLDLPFRDKLGITGVRADLCCGAPGPAMAILCEMDSLVMPNHPAADPVTGAAHACGHHVSCAGMLGAAIGLVQSGIAPELAGKITFIAVPAEECIELDWRMEQIRQKRISALGGKAELIRLGVFDDIDFAYMLHASSEYGEAPHNGFVTKKVTFRGKSCHAAHPGNGINALHAATLAQDAIALLREKWQSERSIRIHGIIISGGSAVNIIPDEVKMEFLLRAENLKLITKLNKEFDRALKGAAMAIGAGIEIVTVPGYMPLVDDDELIQIYSEEAAALDNGAPTKISFSYASTDMGELSTIMPTLHGYTAGCAGAGHSCDFHVADPQRAYITNAKILAGMAVDLLCDNGAKAKEIASHRTGKLSIPEYIQIADSFNSTFTAPVQE